MAATTLRAALAEVLPTADSADNNNMSDVIGNKTDTVAGDSIYAVTQKIDTSVTSIDTLVTNIDTSVTSIDAAVLKIDGAAVDGLNGVYNSLAYRVHEIEKHFHNNEQWFGKDAGDNLLNRDSVTPFTLVAGTSQAYGTEVQLSDGTEIESGSAIKKLDLHEVLVVDNDAGNAVTTFKIQFWYGTGLFAAATLLTEMVCTFYSPSDNHGVIATVCPRIACNNKLWARVKCSVNSKSLSILIGLHTYVA